MENEKKVNVEVKKSAAKPANTKQKTSVAQINNIITSAVDKTRSQAGRDLNKDGTWVSYEDERE